MNKQFFLAFWATVIFTTSAAAQLQLSVQPLEEEFTWGVFVKPEPGLSPSSRTITGSGKIIIVSSIDARISGVSSQSGSWRMSSVVRGPTEAPWQVYFTFEFSKDMPQIFYHDSYETLLFSFRIEGNLNPIPHLADNATDPYLSHLKAMGYRSGNELKAIDFGAKPVGYLHYAGNYDKPGKEIPASANLVLPVATQFVQALTTNAGTTSKLILSSEPQVPGQVHRDER